MSATNICIMADTREMSLLEQLNLQLSEAELLQSMYPKPGEFHIDDPSVLVDISDFVEGKTTDMPSRLDYVVNLHLDKDMKFEVSCSLPHDYPSSEPEVYVRCDQLTRSQKHKLNEDLMQYVSDLERGEICVGSVVQWVQEHGDGYIVASCSRESPTKVESTNIDSVHDISFGRYWIYSHHIYNKMKRRAILEFSRDLQLTGFCLPGKPGILCVEGVDDHCEDFWTKIKHMNWKKIMCKKKEVVEIGDKEIKSFRLFPTFEEISFESRRGTGRDFHMDMGKFYKYLEEHSCGYAFKDYFGVDGKKS